MTIVRAVIGDVPGIAVSTREGFIAVAPTGTAGPAGPAAEWRFHSGYLQARPVDLSSDWANVIAVSAITGPMPDHSWSGTQLRFETEPGVWGSYVDLKGDAVEIGVDSGYIRWRPTGGSWTNIVELADLVGPDGPAIEVQASGTHIQWRVTGDPTWINLVALDDLKGDQGDPGPIGINLPLGPWDSGTAYVARDVVNKDGSSWICLLGHTNQSPPTLPTTANTYWSLLAKIGDTPTSLDISGVAGLTSELLGSAHSAITVAATDIVAEFIYDTTLDDDKGAWSHRCAHTSWWQETLNTATRGSKREFPAKAKIVARQTSVTIYDLTDLDTSGAAKMWMVLPGGAGGNFIRVSVTNPVNGLCALNGRIYVATNALGLQVIDYIADRNECINVARSVWPGGSIGNRAGNLTWPAISGAGIVNAQANHVHALVYPGAPVDTLGLPIPKVVVATPGGVSVIHEDGAVYDVTVANGYSRAAFNLDGRISASRAGGDMVEYGPVFYVDAANTSWRSSTVRAKSLGPADLSALLGTATSLAGEAIGYSVGVCFVAPDYASPTAGMVAYSAVAYATGWQVGDIRGAYLCDTTTGNITGTAELVTNGDFATDLTGWTNSSVGTGAATQSAGTAVLTRVDASNRGELRQPITTVAGQAYILVFDITSGNGTVNVGTSAGGSQLFAGVAQVGAGKYWASFVATGTTSHITIYPATNGVSLTIDNVSCKLGVLDRSYKAKGLQVVGTLSRTAVNTGNDIVAFSGFSSSNYLEQPYSPDLDFGTGDFSFSFWIKATAAAVDYLFCRDTTAMNGKRIAIYTDSSGNLRLQAHSTANVIVTTTGSIAGGAWRHVVGLRRSGVLELWLDGVLLGTSTQAETLSGTTEVFRVGVAPNGSEPATDSSISLFRVSATALSAAQIARMYRDELPIFNAGAKACLGGTSNAVASMAFDSWSRRLLVGTGDGASEFSGLVRVGYFDTSNTPLTNDAMKAVACQGGYRSMAGGQQSIVVRDKVSQHDVVNAYPEQLPAAVANELAAIRALAILSVI